MISPSAGSRKHSDGENEQANKQTNTRARVIAKRDEEDDPRNIRATRCKVRFDWRKKAGILHVCPLTFHRYIFTDTFSPTGKKLELRTSVDI
jgi:hypothetical protein